MRTLFQNTPVSSPTDLARVQRYRCHWGSFGITLGLTLHLLISTLSGPAQAAFYSAAENFFASSFPEAATAIPIIFNVLRALLLIYLAVALIQTLRRTSLPWPVPPPL